MTARGGNIVHRGIGYRIAALPVIRHVARFFRRQRAPVFVGFDRAAPSAERSASWELPPEMRVFAIDPGLATPGERRSWGREEFGAFTPAQEARLREMIREEAIAMQARVFDKLSRRRL